MQALCDDEVQSWTGCSYSCSKTPGLARIGLDVVYTAYCCFECYCNSNDKTVIEVRTERATITTKTCTAKNK